MMSRSRYLFNCCCICRHIFLKRHAVRCEQEHFAIVQHARKPCADSVWMKLDVNVSGCVHIIRLSHCYSFEPSLTPYGSICELLTVFDTGHRCSTSTAADLGT